MRKRIRDTEPVSYWKSMVDAITTLMMVILLILMFFVLNFLVNKGDYDDDTSASGITEQDEPTFTPTPIPSPTPTITQYIIYDDDGGGDGGATTPTTTNDFDGYDKAAIHAVLFDEETEKIIEEPDVLFELYSKDGEKQTLSTYYPLRISYTEFATTDDGGFYLPEKIRMGEYYFHQLTEIKGYDFADDTEFTVDKSYDWSAPMNVKIPVGSSKNGIQLQIDDGVTDEGMPGIIFDVIANGDVKTYDGTVRYQNGEVVDTIKCDDTGYGVSNDLYLGDYVVIPTNLPLGYATPDLATRQITLEKRKDVEEHAPLLEMISNLTTVKVSVFDEYDEKTPVTGMTYELVSDVDDIMSRTFETGEGGSFEITGLRANTNYILREKGVADGFRPNEEVHKFSVDKDGYIEFDESYNIDIMQRKIRMTIGTVDRVLKQELNGYTINLVDSDENVVSTWESDGNPYKVEGIKDGVYKLKIDGIDGYNTINVKDTAKMQSFNATVMTWKSYLVLAVIGLIILSILGVIIFMFIRHRRKMRKSQL